MELYILDNKNLNVLSVCRPCDYNLNLDEETNGKTELVLPSLNSAKKGYYIVLNGLYKQFIFVIDDVITAKDEKCVTVVALDISNIFDRKVILKNKETMKTSGIENYIADEMNKNFINSDDSVLNLNYVDVYVHSNTKASVMINDENGLYNFHTYLINCRQYKNVYTEFEFEGIANRRLRIDIGYKLENAMLIDATLAEVTGYNKIYDVDPVAKVEAYIREDESTYNLYLRTDRTTTTDKNDKNRLDGRIEVISCDTLENAKEEALNVIKANTYKHLVEFNISKKSKLIDVTKLYIGRVIKIKTEDSIYDSYISAITLTDENFVSYKTGNLRIDFTDRQRQQKREGTVGTKLDISGGNITNTLKIQGKTVATEEDTNKKVTKTGDTMSGDLSLPNSKIKFSNNGGVEWKESGYGDGFRIIPDFNGTDDSNKLKIQGSTGKAGDNLNFNDIASISAKNGNVDFKGSVSAAAGFKGTWNGYTADFATANTADTWILVLKGTTIQHRLLMTKFATYEQDTGLKWVDGKTIYIKTVKITSLNSSNPQYQHGISNFGELIDIYGTGYWSGQGWQPIQRVVTDNIGPYGLGLGDVNSTKFMLQVGTSYTGFQKAYITLKYTKK
ncbi:MAG TPA: hypothetical protein OIM45_08270 [Clostridiaceae bacterium]|nr:hypothetical protein [Clostridiaceae bacterium]